MQYVLRHPVRRMLFECAAPSARIECNFKTMEGPSVF
jgi:hypothetical protein